MQRIGCILWQGTGFAIRGKQRSKTNGKYSVIDEFLRNRLLGYCITNQEHVLENIVYLELPRRGYEISTRKIKNSEIDFVVGKQ